jgi:hypothetical protein
MLLQMTVRYLIPRFRLMWKQTLSKALARPRFIFLQHKPADSTPPVRTP